MKIKLSFALVLGLMLALFAPRAAHADLGYYSQSLLGTWEHPTNGDVLEFHSDATYIFTAGPEKRRGGDFVHRGFWKLYTVDTPPESGESGLLLKVRSRVVMEDGGKRTYNMTQELRHRIEYPSYEGDDGTAAATKENNFYIIDGAKWKRLIG